MLIALNYKDIKFYVLLVLSNIYFLIKNLKTNTYYSLEINHIFTNLNILDE